MAPPTPDRAMAMEGLIRAEQIGGDFHKSGHDLAAAPRVALVSGAAVPLLARIRQNKAVLLANYLATAEASKAGALITPAAEWLIDNHHIVEESFRHLLRDLAPRYVDSLPKLALDTGGEVPAVAALAWQHVAQTGSEFHLDTLTAMVEGFQSVRILRIGELWAIPAMLRLVLLENLRRLSGQVARARNLRAEANRVADLVIRDGGAEATLPRMLGSAIADTTAAQLLYRFRDGMANADQGMAWLDRALAAQGTDTALVLAREHGRQSVANVIAGNIIRSLKRLDETNWAEWFETVSKVDETLRASPDFPRLDRATRNSYRQTIERIARRSRIEETEVARRALDLAGGEAAGHLLVGGRLAELEAACGYSPRPGERLLALLRRAGWISIFLPALVLTIALGLLLAVLLPAGLPGAVIALLFVLVLPVASEAAWGIGSFAAARLVAPAHLPAYDFRHGIPEDARTLVAIPCMIPDFDAVDELTDRLELHYLANPDGAVDFALLSDWPDAKVEESAADREVLDHAQAAIAGLAAKYAHVGHRFYLLHRRRVWNEADGKWMGWERKRGKLAELNALLLNDSETTFVATGPRPPRGIRFVITLDSDTRMPRGTVADLVGKMMHPVNRPVTDAASGRVIAGHGLIQPRITPSLTTGAEASVFQHIFSQGRGLAPYVFAVSDLYQDLLDEGSFTGKGIYDLRAFHAATGNRLPENAVLSHDLIEGCLARAGLATDVQLVEDFPIRYDADVSRQHRWTRGDWQLLPFLLDQRNGVNALGRLKMVDNLRRSLVPPGFLAGSVLGWLALPPVLAWQWQVALIAVLHSATILNFLADLVPGQRGISAAQYAGRVGREFAARLQEIALRLVFVADQAAVMVDAIVRTLWRLAVSHRRMLEWRTARAAGEGTGGGIGDWYRRMAAGPALALLALGLTAVINRANLPLAGVFCALWALSPLIAWAVSQTMETEDRLGVAPADAADLRRVARVTWRYFETFVTGETHHLPPDNVQETPQQKVAERTSPTNIGLYLLSVLTARDMGWIGLRQAVDRIDATLATLERMERHRGHWFNWYDTRDLAALRPRYISAVDSGNLAGHLLALATALREWSANPAVHQYASLRGIGDTLAALRASLATIPDDRRALRPLRRRLEERLAGFAQLHGNYLTETQLAPVRALNLVVIATDICRLTADLEAEDPREAIAELVWWADALRENCDQLIGDAERSPSGRAEFVQKTGALAELARRLAFEMDFSFLLNAEKKLLAIGYRFDTAELDTSCYDLLASEARLASLFAIAKGDIPTEHWWRLGRPVTTVGLRATLLSWSGSMFEYLMPPLVMHERTGGILNASSLMCVRAQMRHGRRRGLPWGVSESAFNARDHDMNYQYHAFGVPALGLKRMPSEDRVVAPYATLLAAQFFPAEAVANLRRLDRLGAFGRYGYCDALDFTRARLPKGQGHVVVRNFMAHHHGMSIVAIGNAVRDGIHRDRFHADPVIEAAELLLQERAPREVVPLIRASDSASGWHDRWTPDESLAVSDDPLRDRRLVALLSNGTWSTRLSSSGAGPSRHGDIAVTRWRPDPSHDRGGTALFLRDLRSGLWWSATPEPRREPGETASIVFSDHKAEFRKAVDGIHSTLEVIVAANAAAEGRRLTIRNTSLRTRHVEVTSYGEIVLDQEAADQAHPAFSKMFVRTEIAPDARRITATRTPRGTGDRARHMAHLLCGADYTRPAEAETDRRAFIGRGRDLADAAAFDEGATLAGHDGHTLDPIFAIRQVVTLPPNKEIALVFWTAVAETPEDLDLQVRGCHEPGRFEQEERLAWTMSQVQLRHLGVSLEEAALFRRVAAAVLWHDPRLVVQDIEARAALGPQDRLWALGVSGDRPIILIMIDDESDLPIIRQALRMADYFRLHALAADLVILNDQKSTYVADLQTALQTICDMNLRAAHVDPARRRVFALRRDQIGDDSHATLLAAARIVMHTRNGKIGEQMARLDAAAAAAARGPRPVLALPPPAPPRTAPEFPAETLDFWNGYGGFARDTREYVVRLRHGERTPHPWINVIAREDFGFHVSAGGAAFTWSQNSRDYQITPWSNDPVIDPPGEAILIRDTATGAVISPFAALSDDPAALHEARHGIGMSTFRVWAGWVEAEAVMLLAADAPARLTRVTLRNRGARPLRLEVAAYAELVLGNDRGRTAPMIRAHHDAALDALVARNPFAHDIRDRVTVMAADRPFAATTVSRSGFLGPEGSLVRPVALTAWPEAVHDGDPCLAGKVALTIAPGAEETVTFVLADTGADEVDALLQRTRAPGAFAAARGRVREEWGEFLGRLQVSTPDPRLDLMVNTWLPYQVLSCRLLGRSAFYQASGAFGFRDQLQDAANMLLHDPGLLRGQILNAAARQFEEGDVQHWWLPRTGAGVRTTISDDLVWLAHVTAQYVDATGDKGLLDEELPFVTGAALEPGQHDAFFVPGITDRRVTVYEHCALALDLAARRTSARGLPLILGGDWNDGMNRVGVDGRGESIWLGWFILATLDLFLPLARARGDGKRVKGWTAHRARVLAALEEHGWDGGWYRRATYDDGTPVGSQDSDECRIDSIAQSWSSISGAGRPERSRQALDAALDHLHDREARLLRLFTPPFAQTPRDPGYIKAYPPGVRENGGQYTHAAAWMVFALGRAGRADEALALFRDLNPVTHAETREAVDRYRVEPYVVAADVYGAGDKTGRGGWTWYTGSAGWLYRAAVEGILGIRLVGGRLKVDPALPAGWPGFTATVAVAGTRYRVTVERRDGEVRTAIGEDRGAE